MIHAKLLKRYADFRETLYKRFSKFHHIENLEGPNVLVLSPHPDDDIFGCGGTLAKHKNLGHTVKIVYLCNGDKGCDKTNKTGIVEIRRQEAITAAALLGIKAADLIFLNCPDEQLKPVESLTGQIRDLIGAFSPDLIYLPSFLDNHPDHWNTNLILQATGVKGVNICAFEVWTPIIPNRLVDISAFAALKRKAMLAHQSQLQQLDYQQAVFGLNQYRAKLYSKKAMDYAEAFLFMPVEHYVGLYRAR
ncbi:MAG: PIG-L family deacetylase [Saprospiraceae bacterium]